MAVDSVYGRTGAVTAQSGDYSSDEVTNASGVAGATAADALDSLATAAAAKADASSTVAEVDAVAGDLSGNVLAPSVVGIRGTAVASTAETPSDGDELGVVGGEYGPISNGGENFLFKTLYELDFTTLPSADLKAAAPTVTIDGKQWTVKNEGDANEIALVNGVGLRFVHSAASTNWIHNQHTTPCVWVPLTTLSSSITASRMKAIRLSFWLDVPGFTAADECVYGALMRVPWANDKQISYRLGKAYVSAGWRWQLHADRTSAGAGADVHYAPDVTGDVGVVVMRSLLTAEFYTGTYASGFPGGSAQTFRGTDRVGGMWQSFGGDDTVGVMLGVFQSHAVGTTTGIFKRIRIEAT